MKEKSKYEQEGLDAYENGADLFENPYRGTDIGDEWDDGWWEGFFGEDF